MESIKQFRRFCLILEEVLILRDTLSSKVLQNFGGSTRYGTHIVRVFLISVNDDYFVLSSFIFHLGQELKFNNNIPEFFFTKPLSVTVVRLLRSHTTVPKILYFELKTCYKTF